MFGSARGILSAHAVNVNNAGTIGGAIGLEVDGASTAFAITNSGTIWSTDTNAIILYGSAKHIVTNSGQIFGNIDASSIGNTVINNTGFIGGALNLNDGIDAVTNRGVITNFINLYASNDTLTNFGDIFAAVDFGGGNDIGSNSGRIYSVDMGIGNDTFTNTGILQNSVDEPGVTRIFMGEGNDTLLNSGTIFNDVGMWDGNDKFTNTGTVNGWIYMGLGDDTFIGGAQSDNVADDGGTDSYALGDGFDTFFAVLGNSGDGFIDKVDGGLNTGSRPIGGNFGDLYDASAALSNVNINLDIVAHVDATYSATLAAGTATGLGIGTDLVKGFEAVIGGAMEDIIYGNASANFIDGGGSSDSLHGGAGNDRILGGDLNDTIFGDAGKDTLFGEAGTDYFSYQSITDSKVALGGRDIIADYNNTDDVIDFHLMHISGGHLMGVDQAFDGTLGALRAITTAGGWTLQLDVDGDKKVDMAITVVDTAHATTWSVGDFLF